MRKLLFKHLLETQVTYRGGMYMIWGINSQLPKSQKDIEKEYLRQRITDTLLKIQTKLEIKSSHSFEWGRQILLYDLQEGDIDIILELSMENVIYQTQPIRFDDNELMGCMGVEEYYRRVHDTNDDIENTKNIKHSVNKNKKWVNGKVDNPNNYVILTDWWSPK